MLIDIDNLRRFYEKPFREYFVGIYSKLSDKNKQAYFWYNSENYILFGYNKLKKKYLPHPTKFEVLFDGSGISFMNNTKKNRSEGHQLLDYFIKRYFYPH